MPLDDAEENHLDYEEGLRAGIRLCAEIRERQAQLRKQANEAYAALDEQYIREIRRLFRGKSN